jgi:plasmid stabilization system protein ParE
MEEARQALDETLEHIAEESPEGAHAVLEQALAAAAGLETLSERGRVVPELSNLAIREVFVFQYRLVCQVTTSEVRILSLLHGARDFAKWRRGL